MSLLFETGRTERTRGCARICRTIVLLNGDARVELLSTLQSEVPYACELAFRGNAEAVSASPPAMLVADWLLRAAQLALS